jgi:uncharacterized protein YcfJ
MKQTLLFAALGLAAFGASAQEFGNVLSSVPVIQQVAVPRTMCAPVGPSQVTTTGAGGVVGGLTGAGIGSAIGAGTGNVAAMAAGTIIGAIVGNNVEAQNQRYAQTVPQCSTETYLENRTVAYDVTYEYHGQQYQARMPYDPGRNIQLQTQQVAQAPAGNAGVVVAPPVQQGAVSTTTQPVPVIVQQAPVQVVYQQPYAAYPAYAYPAYPAYPYPYYRPYYPVGVSLGFVFGGGRHWHR